MEYVRVEEQGDLSEKQLDVVERVLKSGRRTFGSSGASLTHQIHNPKFNEKGIDASLAKVGLSGEHTTSKMLRNWIKDKPNVVLVDSIHVRGYGDKEEVVDEETGVIEGGDTDHILIAGDFIILIDSKNWKNKKKYSVNKSGEVLRTNKPFPGGKVKMKQANYLWKAYLRPYKPSTISIINITSPEVFVVRDTHWWQNRDFKLLTMNELTEFLDKIWEQVSDDSKNKINVNLVTAVVTQIIKPYDVYRENIKSASRLLDI